jgi:excisionase family DNA binding protein
MSAIEGLGHGDCTDKLELLTVSEVSAMLSVSKMTVYRMIHSGELEHVQAGRSYQVVGASLRRLMRNSSDSFGDAAWRKMVESGASFRLRMEHI